MTGWLAYCNVSVRLHSHVLHKLVAAVYASPHQRVQHWPSCKYFCLDGTNRPMSVTQVWKHPGYNDSSWPHVSDTCSQPVGTRLSTGAEVCKATHQAVLFPRCRVSLCIASTLVCRLCVVSLLIVLTVLLHMAVVGHNDLFDMQH